MISIVSRETYNLSLIITRLIHFSTRRYAGVSPPHISCKKPHVFADFSTWSCTQPLLRRSASVSSAKKPLLLRHFKATRHFRPILHTLIIAPYPAAVCNFCSSGSFFRLLLHTITAATRHKDGNSRGRTLIATRPVCFDRLTPQTATTSYVIGSAIRAKTQLFHVKHRFLQCFSLEFYLLFALSCCRFV